jgi:hypothetical protein
MVRQNRAGSPRQEQERKPGMTRTLTSGARLALTTLVLGAALAGCRSAGDLVVDQGVGITAIRTVCPAVGIPDHTGNVTLFAAPGAVTADAIDVTASITNLRTSCNEAGGDRVYSESTFDVLARRSDASTARRVELPFFATAVRGNNSIVSKRIGTVTLDFQPGETRTQASARAATYIDRAEATLPDEVRERLTRRREPGDPDAALDPLADPEVRAAVARASFELLIGFQLSEEQLAYNATR